MKIDVIIGFFILAVWIGFIPLDFGAFNGIAEDILKDAGADSVNVKNVSVILIGGIRINEISVYKQINKKEFYRAEISQVNIYCKPLNLLFSRNLLLDERDIFMEIYEKPIILAGEAVTLINSLGFIKKMDLSGAKISFKTGLSAENISVNLLRKKNIHGNIAIEKITIPSVASIENFSAKLLSNSEILNIFSATADVLNGKLSAEVSIDLNNFRTVGGFAKINGLDLARFCKETKFSPGRLSGIADFNVEIEKNTALMLDSIKLNGNFSVSNLVVSDLALQRLSVVRNASKDLRVLKFSEVNGEFAFLNGKVDFKKITGKGNTMNFTSVGWFKFDGSIYQKFEGEFSPKFVLGLSRLVRNSLEKTENGGGKFHCTISQKFHNPKIKVDKAVYKRAIKNAFKK
jgi:hypothetical protein